MKIMNEYEKKKERDRAISEDEADDFMFKSPDGRHGLSNKYANVDVEFDDDFEDGDLFNEANEKWTTVTKKRNNKNNNKNSSNNGSPSSLLNNFAQSGDLLSPTTKVIKEASEFLSNDDDKRQKSKKKPTQRNLGFDNNNNNNNNDNNNNDNNNKITSPPPKVKLLKKISLSDDDYFSESGGTPSPNAQARNEYFTKKKPDELKSKSKKGNNNDDKKSEEEVNFRTTTMTIDNDDGDGDDNKITFEKRKNHHQRSAISFSNLSRESSMDQMEALFSPSDALDAFGMPSPPASPEGSVRRGAKLLGTKLHLKLSRKESVSQIDSILEKNENDGDDINDGDKGGKGDNSSSDIPRGGGGGFGSPFKKNNEAFESKSMRCDGKTNEIDTNNKKTVTKNNNNNNKIITEENLDLSLFKKVMEEKFLNYKTNEDFTLEKALEMLKKAELLLSQDAKSALEIDVRLVKLEQELREMRQDLTLFLYGIGGIFLAWFSMKAFYWFASFFV